ncbi:MAG: hypothetical protein Q4A74_05050, partial [Cardiobacteriaceae bacterium]|nr:hypothetical protein [Cardiobacteriaceae bacterium]
VPRKTLPLVPLKVRVRGTVEREIIDNDNRFLNTRAEMMNLRNAFGTQIYRHPNLGELQIALHFWQQEKRVRYGSYVTQNFKLRWRWRYKELDKTKETVITTPLVYVMTNKKDAQHEVLNYLIAPIKNNPLFSQIIDYETARIELNTFLSQYGAFKKELRALSDTWQWRDGLLLQSHQQESIQMDLIAYSSQQGNRTNKT